MAEIWRILKVCKNIQDSIVIIFFVELLAKEKKIPTLRDLCDLQKMITHDLLKDKKQCCNIRTIKVEMVDAHTNKIIDSVPEPHFLNELLEDLWKWLKDQEIVNPFVSVFAVHYMAVAIHPFADGNGRIKCLMQHLLLLKKGETIGRYVPSETAIMSKESPSLFKKSAVRKN